jgi:hypothetical protein
VRRSFIRRALPGDQPPPLARMVRGGRGGSVRIRLYLSMLLVGRWPPHSTEFKASAWARLLGLPDPLGNGARRITDAISWLHDHEFLVAHRGTAIPRSASYLTTAGRALPINGLTTLSTCTFPSPFDSGRVVGWRPLMALL